MSAALLDQVINATLKKPSEEIHQTLRPQTLTAGKEEAVIIMCCESK